MYESIFNDSHCFCMAMFLYVLYIVYFIHIICTYYIAVSLCASLEKNKIPFHNKVYKKRIGKVVLSVSYPENWKIREKFQNAFFYST